MLPILTHYLQGEGEREEEEEEEEEERWRRGCVHPSMLYKIIMILYHGKVS